MATSYQQILAVDARYSLHRVPNDPQFRTLYIRRRSQLLQQLFLSPSSEIVNPESITENRKQYLKTRMALLAKKYGPQYDDKSLFGSSGKSSRARSISRSTIGSSRILENGKGDGGALHVTRMRHPEQMMDIAKQTKSAGESYAFSGVQHIFDQHKKSVGCVRFSNDDKHRLACCSADGSLSVITLLPNYGDGEAPYSIVLLKGHENEVMDFSWGTSGDLIVSCSLDGTVRLWDTHSGNSLRTVQDHFRCGILSCTFHPKNNNFVVTGNERGFLQVLNVSTGKFHSESLVKTNGRVLCMCFDIVSNVLWIGNDNATIFSFLFDVLSSKFILIKQIHLSSKSVMISSVSARTIPNSIGVSPIRPISNLSNSSESRKSTFILLNCSGNSLLLMQVIDNDLRNQQLSLKRRFAIRQRKFRVKSSFCPMVVPRPGACVVSGSEDGRILFYDSEKPINKTCINELQGHSAPVLDVCFNEDESLLASCDANGIVIIWKRL